MTTISTFGFFPDSSRASSVVERLREAGFLPTDISVLLPLAKSQQTGDKGHPVGDEQDRNPENIATGATCGALIGSVFGFLVGGAAAIVVPGVGPMMAAGPMVGALGGGLAGGLAVFDMPKEDATEYEGGVAAGGTLVSVHCEDPERIALARRIFVECGAQNPVSVTLTPEHEPVTR
jgi:outer membrane lipoprotein SlyB